MIRLVFSVFDNATKGFMLPFYANSIEEAIRSFRLLLRDDNPISQFPDDYTLFHVGQFDEKTGLHTSLETPHSLGLALSFVPTETP